MLNQRCGQLGLGAIGLGSGRDTRLRTAGRVGAPGRGQVQLPAHQPGVDAPAQHGEHAHLPVADLAHLPDILAGHAHTFVPCLLPAALIEQQALLAAERGQTGLHPPRHFVHDGQPIPGRNADKVVQGIVVRIGQAFVHPLHIASTSVK